MQYRLPILKWSATDYSYLNNNQLGWVSDDQRWYEFETEANMRQFQSYLIEYKV